ncbi:MAG: hypothetical protein REI64_13195 [Pedobacter sp.]|uniref:hypothetical protein n=1 Tax=Pedobacter sp. TaxID=1411316 RepID=UPI002808F098|nr:hypothetical protein [Pedobacter sp.]MDQ8005754.1 hypothetical protein [Pedobacter sp.]
MDILGFLIVVSLVFIGLPTAIGWLIYIILKRLNYRKTAKWLVLIYAAFLCIIILETIFNDELFTKGDAKKFAKQLNIELYDNFNLIENQSKWSVGDYYQTFSLRISKSDKERIIQSIKSDTNFIALGKPITNFLYDPNVDKYNGKKVTQNYEVDDAFVRELFIPNGDGYAPTFYKISIYKVGTIVVFEDIDN